MQMDDDDYDSNNNNNNNNNISTHGHHHLYVYLYDVCFYDKFYCFILKTGWIFFSQMLTKWMYIILPTYLRTFALEDISCWRILIAFTFAVNNNKIMNNHRGIIIRKWAEKYPFLMGTGTGGFK